MKRLTLASAALAVASMLMLVPAAGAVDKVNTKKLRKAVTVKRILQHERALQKIAIANDDNRAASTPGYDASVEYVAKRLRRANYKVKLVEFPFPKWAENSPSQLSQTAPAQKAYSNGPDFLTAEFSGAGNVTAAVVPTTDVIIPPSAAPSSTSGCEAADFPPTTSGKVALIQRGTCPFVQKIDNAKAAGAAAVLIFNEGQEGRTDTIAIGATPFIGIPVLFTSFGVGKELYDASKAPGGASVNVVTNTTTTPDTQVNVIADSRYGDPNKTVVVGAHLDSVDAGPGINDNGSGTASDLAVAEAIDKLKKKPRNRLRFAFWGAEEAGLIGSTAYVNGLSADERKKILLNLNFDMVGSPNFVRFVYDGDSSDTPPPAGGAPPGSGAIERVFLRYFESQGLATDPTAFDGRSDYGGFITNGIPAGGLFTGAEGIKTERQAQVYGGFAGLAYDPCYHQACDTFFNLSHESLDQMSDAIAHATWTFARSKSGVTSAKAAKRAKAKRAKKRQNTLRFRGSKANK